MFVPELMNFRCFLVKILKTRTAKIYLKIVLKWNIWSLHPVMRPDDDMERHAV